MAARLLVGGAIVTALATGFALFSPLSPVTIDVESRRVEAGVKGTVSLGNVQFTFRPPKAAKLTIRRHRDLSSRKSPIGSVYEFKVSPNLVSARRPAKITLPLPSPRDPGSETLVTFRSSAGWVAHPAVVGRDGRSATATVSHLSRWAAIDILDFVRSLRDNVLRGLGVRTEKPPCKAAPGVRTINRNDDPLAWVCVSVTKGSARRIVITSNFGAPLLLRVTGPMRLVKRPRGGGLVEQLAKPLYQRGKVLLVPPSESVELAWNGSADGSVRLESEVPTVFVRAVLTLASASTVAGVEAATALIAAIDCLATARGGVAKAWQPCLGATTNVAERLELRHAGVRIAAKTLDRLLKLLGVAGAFDLFIEKTFRHREPFLTHLKAPVHRPHQPTTPGRMPGRTARAPRAVDVVVHGCH